MKKYELLSLRIVSLLSSITLWTGCADSPSTTNESPSTVVMYDGNFPSAKMSELNATTESILNPFYIGDSSLNVSSYQNKQAQDVDPSNGDIYTAASCAVPTPTFAPKFCIFRHSANGELNRTFEGPFGNRTDCHAEHLKLTSDKKVLFTAGCGFERRELLIGRFLPDGKLDTTFASGTGYLAFRMGSQLYPTVAEELAIDQDGRILVAGVYRESPFSYYFSFVRRFNADGSIDTSFATGGTYVYTGVSDVYYYLGMKLLQDGKILLSAHNGGHIGRLIQLLPNGAVNTAFGNSGVAIPNVAMSIDNVLVQSTGKIIIAGAGGQRFYQHIQRLNADGSNDASFKKMLLVGNGAEYGMEGWWGSVALQADDKIVYGYLGCRSTVPNRPTCRNGTPEAQMIHSLTVKRLLPDGEDDLSFGAQATQSLDLESGKARFNINRPSVFVGPQKIFIFSANGIAKTAAFNIQ